MVQVIKVRPYNLTNNGTAESTSFEVMQKAEEIAHMYNLKTKIYHYDDISEKVYASKSLRQISKDDATLSIKRYLSNITYVNATEYLKSIYLMDIIENGKTIATAMTAQKIDKNGIITNDVTYGLFINDAVSTFIATNDYRNDEEFAKLFRSSYLRPFKKPGYWQTHKNAHKSIMEYIRFGSKEDIDSFSTWSNKDLFQLSDTYEHNNVPRSKIICNNITHGFCVLRNVSDRLNSTKKLLNENNRKEKIMFFTASLAEVFDEAFGEDEYEIVKNTVEFENKLKPKSSFYGEITLNYKNNYIRVQVGGNYDFIEDKYISLQLTYKNSITPDGDNKTNKFEKSVVLNGSLKETMVSRLNLSKKIEDEKLKKVEEKDKFNQLDYRLYNGNESVAALTTPLYRSDYAPDGDIRYAISFERTSYYNYSISASYEFKDLITDEDKSVIVTEHSINYRDLINLISFTVNLGDRYEGTTLYDEDEFDEKIMEMAEILKIEYVN
jgi:hypothetical protein